MPQKRALTKRLRERQLKRIVWSSLEIAEDWLAAEVQQPEAPVKAGVEEAARVNAGRERKASAVGRKNNKDARPRGCAKAQRQSGLSSQCVFAGENWCYSLRQQGRAVQARVAVSRCKRALRTEYADQQWC